MVEIPKIPQLLCYETYERRQINSGNTLGLFLDQFTIRRQLVFNLIYYNAGFSLSTQCAQMLKCAFRWVHSKAFYVTTKDL